MSITGKTSGLSLALSTQRRRAKLTDLEREIDELTWEERRRAVRALLARPLLSGISTSRTLVMRHRDWLALWFSHHLGWELSVDAEACRLVKRPADILDSSRPCRDPASKDSALTRRGYCFLCLTLSVLVRQGRQLTLKNIAENLGGIARSNPLFEENGIPLDLDARPARRDLVQALRVLLDWEVLARVDGEEDGFVTRQETDVLYTVNRPILSRLLASRQPPSLIKEEDAEKRLTALWQGAASSDSEDQRRREIRFCLFRRLIDDPVLYYADLAADERDYLEKQRHFIVREIERATGLIAEIRSEGLAMVDRSADLSDYSLPETGTDGHVTLLLATFLADLLRAGKDIPVPVTRLESETARLAKIHKGWRKDARQPGSEKVLTADALRRLEALGLIRLRQQPEPCVTPLPAIGRFGLRELADTNAQLDLV